MAHPAAAALLAGAVVVGVTASAAVVRDPAMATGMARAVAVAAAGVAGETGSARAAAGVA